MNTVLAILAGMGVWFLIDKLYNIVAAILKGVRSPFRKKCRHQFLDTEVQDLNCDPRCIHCKTWLSHIEATEDITLDPVWDEATEHYIYTAKKLCK